MSRLFDWLFPPNLKEQHADEKREATHQALNDIQVAMIRYQHKNRRDKEKIIQILSQSEAELSDVAEKVAAATGAAKRGFND